MSPRGTIWGSFCIVVTLSDIETIWTKFGQNPGFSLGNSVSLTPGPTVNKWVHRGVQTDGQTDMEVEIVI